MQVRMANPAMSVPGAFDALTALASAAGSGGLPESTAELVHCEQARSTVVGYAFTCTHATSRRWARVMIGSGLSQPGGIRLSSPMLSVLRWRLPTLLPGSATAQTRYPMRSSRKLQSSSRSQLWPH